jgi:1L-myo-inositol 1-phosphate cytidylyltransferase / CDP-L-myo-inositol myo-inositolphosphotransferase
MIETLIIPFWSACPSAHVRLLGLDFEDRVALQAQKLGFKQIITRLRKGEATELPEAFLVLFPDILLADAAWKRLSALRPEPETLTMIDGIDSLAAVRSRDRQFLSSALETSERYPSLVATLKARLGCKCIRLGEQDWVWLQSDADRARVERWLLHGLIKESEGFMSRHVERRISLAVTRRLVDTRMTPNEMTLVSVAIGLIGARFFAGPRRSQHLLGALLFWLHSVLDGCDGELARLKFAESRWGGLIDFWGDNVVHSAVFYAIAKNLHAEEPGPKPFRLAAAAVAGTLLSAALVYWTTMRETTSNGPLFTSVVHAPALAENRSNPIARIADQLARRDFIYLVVGLAILGKVRWFLQMAAVGAPLYFLVLAGLSLKNSSVGSHPNSPRKLHNE